MESHIYSKYYFDYGKRTMVIVFGFAIAPTGMPD